MNNARNLSQSEYEDVKAQWDDRKHGQIRHGKWKTGMGVLWNDKKWFVYELQANSSSSDGVELVLVSPNFTWMADSVSTDEVTVPGRMAGLMDMDLDEMDEQSRQFAKDLEANGWEEKEIGFYYNRKYPLIFVDVNGLAGEILAISKDHLLEEYVDTYAELERFLRSSKYREFEKFSKIIDDLKGASGWRPYTKGMNRDFYVNDKYPGVGLWPYSPDSEIRVIPVHETMGGIFDGHQAIGRADNFNQAMGIVKRHFQKSGGEMNKEAVAKELVLIAKELMAGRNAIEVVRIPGAIMEREPKFMIMFRGQKWGELSFNMRGYTAEHGIPVPSSDGSGKAVGLDIGEKSLGAFKSEISRANREWAMVKTASAPFTPRTAKKDVADRLSKAGIKFQSLSVKTTDFGGLGYGSGIFVTIHGAVLPMGYKDSLFSDIPRPSQGGYIVSLRNCQIQREDGTTFTPMF